MGFLCYLGFIHDRNIAVVCALILGQKGCLKMPFEIPEELRSLTAVGIARLVDGEKGRAGWEPIVAAKRTWKDAHPDRRHGPDICTTALLNSGVCSALEIDWAELRPMLGADSAAAYFGFCAGCVQRIEAAGMRVLAGSHKEAVQAAQRDRQGAPDRGVARGPDIRPGRVIADSGGAVLARVAPERAGPHRVTPPPAAVAPVMAAAAVAPRVETPAPELAPMDPIAVMDLATVEQQLAALRGLRAVMGEQAYIAIAFKLLKRRRELEDERIAQTRRAEDENLARVRAEEDAELGKTLGKGQADRRPAAPVLQLVLDGGPRVETVSSVGGGGADPNEQEWAEGAEHAPKPTILVCSACDSVKGDPHARLADVPTFKSDQFASAEACFDALAQTGARYRDLVRIHAPETATEAVLRNPDSEATKQAKMEAKNCPFHGPEVRKLGGFRYSVIEHIKEKWPDQWRERKHAGDEDNGHTTPACAYCNSPGGTKMYEEKPACVKCKNQLTATKREGRRNARAANDADLRTRMKGAAGGGGGRKKGGGRR